MSKHNIMMHGLLSAVLVCSVISVAGAAEVTLPYKFTAGTPAVADQVNANFDAVKDAVNNNHARITTLEGVNAAARLTFLETFAASPDISGNLTLAPSTAGEGNVYKGTAPFLHDYGIQNTFLGVYAGNFSMTGAYNTAMGRNALTSNTTGVSNTASGVHALMYNTTGFYNTGFGSRALFSNTVGYGNTANGFQSLEANTEGVYNTANGRYSLANNTIGNYNTALGAYALQNNTGNGNVGLGYSAGANLTNGVNNIVIDNSGVAGESNTTRIGDTQSRTFIAGIRGVTTGFTDAITVMIDSHGQLGTVSSSRRVKDHINDMGDASQVLLQLRPVTFYYKTDHNPKGRTLQYGLIAEEVAKVAPQLVTHSKDGAIETVYYQHLTPMLLNEYQKQQRILAAQAELLQRQAATLASQAAQITRLEQARSIQAARLTALEQQVMQITTVQARLQQQESLAAASQR